MQLEDANREGIRQKVADLKTFFGELDGDIIRGREHIVKKTFIKILDELGYDVELTYKKKAKE